jgi:hypothetical protein
VDLGNESTVQQSNGFRVRFRLGKNDLGEPKFIDADAFSSDGTQTDGSIVDGMIEDDRFVVKVEWGDSGASGRYSGRRDIDGTLSGVTFDLLNRESQATWFVPERTFPA